MIERTLEIEMDYMKPKTLRAGTLESTECFILNDVPYMVVTCDVINDLDSITAVNLDLGIVTTISGVEIVETTTSTLRLKKIMEVPDNV